MTIEEQTLRAAHAREAAQGRAERRARGIVHTPSALAAWALARVEHALQSDLGLAFGLTDPRVCVLDPAVGTGIWLAAALARVSVTAEVARRTWAGFDVDPQVLDTTRGLLLEAAAQRNIQLALTQANTLELSDPWSALGARQVRVILGNPPWAARSLSRGAELSDAWLRDFMCDADGEPLRERRIGVLSDDYVRFFRWALEQARTAPEGAVVCFASNSSFLDGPVHRGMRAQLRRGFDRVEVLDLGGNALVARDGQRDENLFGVRVGAALTLLVRTPSARQGSSSVGYHRVGGSRAHKLAWLSQPHAGAFSPLVPRAPWYRFVPSARVDELDHGFALDEAFPFHREGVQTNRDAVAVGNTREQLLDKLVAVARGEHVLSRSRHFDPVVARYRLAQALERDPQACLTELAYRPLDTRFVCTVTPLCHRPRPELLRAVERSELCLLSVRKDRGGLAYNLFAASPLVADACFLSVRSSCRTRVFPTHDSDGRENLGPRVHDELARRVGSQVSARELVEYVLGVLASETFRQRAGDALKLDYARLPWPRDAATLQSMAQAGRLLVQAASWPYGQPEARSRERAVPRAAVRSEPERERVIVGDECVLTGVPQALFDARMGHHAILASALRARAVWTPSQVLAVIERATLWTQARQLGEQSYLRAWR